jgi:hypothetical protein
MADLETALADNRAAVAEFVAAARTIDGQKWATPRAPGAWTPAQIAEHLAITYEYGRKMIQGTAGRGAPFFLRPLIRKVALDNPVKTGRFARKAKTPKPFRPTDAPGPQPQVLERLNAAVSGLESDLRARTPQDRETILSPYFGKVKSADYIMLQAIHARHHRAQLPSA